MVRLPEGLRPYFGPLKRAYTAGTRTVAPATIRMSARRGGWLPDGVAATMEDAATDAGRFTLARPEEILHRARPVGVPDRFPAFEEALAEVIPRVGVVELDGGRVLQPHSLVVTRDNRQLHEQCWYFGTKRPREHPVFLHPFPPPPVEVPGRLGVLATRGDLNYYHFLLDVLPRTDVLEQAGVEPPDRWYVPYGAGWQRELLRLWGIDEDQVVDSSAVPHVRAQTLVVPGLPTTDDSTPPWVVQLLRRKLMPAGLDRIPGNHVFITRGPSRNNRTILNEPEVRALLEPLGFTPLEPAALSITEQIRAYAEADIIVGAHGAALTNVAFCSPGSAVVELFPSGSMTPDFWKVTLGAEGVDYRYLSGAGKPIAPTRAAMVVADITVDLAALEATVSELLAARESAGGAR